MSEDLAAVTGVLERLADELGQVVRQLRPRGGRTITRRLVLTSKSNPIEVPVDDGYPVRSVLVENPNAGVGLTVEVGFNPGDGRPGQSDRRVPPQTGTMIVHRAEHLSIGIDRATLPAAGAEVFLTLYDEPQTANSYPFAP